MLALNANEAKIEEKADIAYKETIKYIETKIKELETIINNIHTKYTSYKEIEEKIERIWLQTKTQKEQETLMEKLHNILTKLYNKGEK